MSGREAIYLEIGRKRVFAGGVEWPGWCRSGRAEDAAIEALLACGPRYAKALGKAAADFEPPGDASALEVVERLKGDASTEFGVPGQSPSADDRELDAGATTALTAMLTASWRAFDRAARKAEGAVLRKGPRGGGRELDAILSHVLEAERAYLSRLGASQKSPPDADPAGQMAAVRQSVLALLPSRARGEPPPPSRRTSRPWSARYYVRRSIWHALDHAWEIQDRSQR